MAFAWMSILPHPDTYLPELRHPHHIATNLHILQLEKRIRILEKQLDKKGQGNLFPEGIRKF